MFNEVQGQVYCALPLSVFSVVDRVPEIQRGSGKKHTGAIKQRALSNCSIRIAEVLM
jgi:hypothetical protein